jgi:hypothetical protein
VDREGRPLAKAFAGHHDRATVQLDNASRQTEADAESAALAIMPLLTLK